MKNSDELRDELNDSPFLKKMKEQPSEGFQVPKHYFKHLPNEVMRQVKQPAPSPVPSGTSWLEQLEQFVMGLFKPRFALALATVLVLVVAGVVFFRDSGAEGPQPIAAVRLEDIPDEELLAYLDDHIRDFDGDLVQEASVHTLPEVPEKPKAVAPKTSVPKPELEAMEEYIDEVIDEIDVEDLEEML